jgi:hypothetical protein
MCPIEKPPFAAFTRSNDSLQHADDTDMTAVKLRDVPERFFDARAWAEIVMFAGTKQNAIELLDAENPQLSSTWWDCALPETPERDRNRFFARGRSLRSEFHRNLIAGKYDAVGFFSGKPERICIPLERFTELYPRFATERLVGRDLEFTGVLIIEVEKRETPAAQFQRHMTDWMKARRAEGVRLRKILLPAAKRHFDDQFTQRAFDIAYKSVFNSRRGHPPKGL